MDIKLNEYSSTTDADTLMIDDDDASLSASIKSMNMRPKFLSTEKIPRTPGASRSIISKDKRLVLYCHRDTKSLEKVNSELAACLSFEDYTMLDSYQQTNSAHFL